MKTAAIFTLVAVALTINLNATNPSEEFVSSLNTVEEKNIEVADWMLNIDAFDTESEMMEVEEWMTNFDQDVEPLIAVEDWMLDESQFTDYEQLVQVESWMLDESLFTDYESNLAIRDWMLDIQAFKAVENNDDEMIELEEWMTNFDTFYAQF